MSDASDVGGWGYQSSDGPGKISAGGQRGEEVSTLTSGSCWSLFSSSDRNPVPPGTALCFEMDNMVAVHCIAYQGTSKSDLLLSLSERILGSVAFFPIPSGCPGSCRVWKTCGPTPYLISSDRRWSDSFVRSALRLSIGSGALRRWTSSRPGTLPQLQIFLIKGGTDPCGGPKTP
ncbi:hypothetical protein GWK47_014415 [Chionoecetes opilio]|uniref:Uncharacterized protein n=1 Tax=Chionoecetes opilio TaxID=41210 RepID=A0A8J5CIU6_CHIOP|nr:hypothetical protein GWK47_014415 [Chionoecetes opilio]